MIELYYIFSIIANNKEKLFSQSYIIILYVKSRLVREKENFSYVTLVVSKINCNFAV